MVLRAKLGDLILLVALSSISLSHSGEGGFAIGRNPASINIDDEIYSNISGRTLLLNHNNSARSNGFLDTWSFCYFISEMHNMSDVYAGVWRLVGNAYHLVNGSLVKLPSPDLNCDFDFTCLRHSVSPVEVLVGDFVGAIVISAGISVMGFDEEGPGSWMSHLWSSDNNTTSADFILVSNYTLYLQGLGVDDSSSADPATTELDVAEEIQLQHFWAIYAVSFLLLFLIISLCIVCLLSISLHRGGRKSETERIELSRSDSHFTSVHGRDSHELKPDHLPTSHTSTYEEVVQLPGVIFENTYTDDHPTPRPVFSPTTSLRSETFSFPPPSVKAPSPPCTDQANSVPNGDHGNLRMKQERMLRKTQSNPIQSASSLPDLLSDDKLYETPSKSHVFEKPLPYTCFIPTKTPPKSSGHEQEHGTSFVFPSETQVEQSEKVASKAKIRVNRLLSDPMSNSSGQEYAEPLEGEMRARFYSYRGMKIEGLGKKTGALKKPMPLPVIKSSVAKVTLKNVPKRSSATKAALENAYGMSSSAPNEHSSILDSIEEIDEQEPLSRSSSQIPELYLEPMELKGKGN